MLARVEETDEPEELVVKVKGRPRSGRELTAMRCSPRQPDGPGADPVGDFLRASITESSVMGGDGGVVEGVGVACRASSPDCGGGEAGGAPGWGSAR